MPFRPTEIIVHESVEDAYESWRIMALQGRQPGQAIWKRLLACIARLRVDGAMGGSRTTGGDSEVLPREVRNLKSLLHRLGGIP